MPQELDIDLKRLHSTKRREGFGSKRPSYEALSWDLKYQKI
mgnify:CR=1 FL=1